MFINYEINSIKIDGMHLSEKFLDTYLIIIKWVFFEKKIDICMYRVS